MIRELTEKEKTKLRERCLFCVGEDGFDFILGPQALGLSFNIYCADCHAGYNVTHHALPWQLIAEPGEVNERDLNRIASPLVMMDAHTMHEQLSAQIERVTREAYERAQQKRGH